MTKEHLWSDWMDRAQIVPTGGEHTEFKDNIDRFTGKRTQVFERKKQGSPVKKQVRIVCRECNSGWMGELEGRVKPYLTPLITGNRTTLNWVARRTISDWIVMKFMTIEHNPISGQIPRPIFDQAPRDAFRTDRHIPPGFRIWIVSQRGENWSGGFHMHTGGLGVSTTFPPPPPPNPPVQNVQAFTWGISRLLIYCNCTTNMRVYPFLELGPGPFMELWPLARRNIDWPTKYFVGDEFADNLASAMENFVMSPNVFRQ